jgi:hypothetical protein
LQIARLWMLSISTLTLFRAITSEVIDALINLLHARLA